MDYTKFDHVNFIIEYESGNCDEEQVVEGFQHLIDSGVVWHLQGSYGRTAAALIDAGLCSAPAVRQGRVLKGRVQKGQPA